MKYLFEAHLESGEVIRQTPQDVSAIDPIKSCWYDVLQRIDEVYAIALIRPDGTAVAIAGMMDGTFQLGGQSFHALPFDKNNRPLMGGRYRAQYFRRHTHQIDVAGRQMIDLATGYAIGWEYVVDDVVVAKQVIEIY